MWRRLSIPNIFNKLRVQLQKCGPRWGICDYVDLYSDTYACTASAHAVILIVTCLHAGGGGLSARKSTAVWRSQKACMQLACRTNHVRFLICSRLKNFYYVIIM
jgi:hypothetical protein